MGQGVAKTYKRFYRRDMAAALELLGNIEDAKLRADEVVARVEGEIKKSPTLVMDASYVRAEKALLLELQ